MFEESKKSLNSINRTMMMKDIRSSTKENGCAKKKIFPKLSTFEKKRKKSHRRILIFVSKHKDKIKKKNGEIS